MPKVLITTHPFSEKDLRPIELLKKAGIEYVVNPLGRKLKEEEVAVYCSDVDAIIAGTELLGEKVFGQGDRLRLIARVGIGLDGVQLNAAKARGIKVSYTPDAPAPAVAELTMAHILTLLRHVPRADRLLHQGQWKRFFGRRIENITVGIIGGGRIGGRLIRMLSGFNPKMVLLNDNNPEVFTGLPSFVRQSTKEEIYKESDVITLHVPLTAQTKDLITEKEISLMKEGVILVNTSRGGIINEADLLAALKAGKIQSAAIDVFETEPYSGPLTQVDNILLTCHMGSMTDDCRAQMELEATEEVVRFLGGAPLLREVPDFEYASQLQGL